MALSHSPNIIKDGLVLTYDMANIRSFRGESTTNLSYNNGQTGSEYLATSISWTNSGTWTLNTNDTSIAKPDILEIPYLPTLPTNLRIISGVTNTVGSQHHGCGWTSVSPSTTYTMTVWFRQNRAGCSSPYLRTNVNNNSLGNFSYNGSTNSANWPINKWIQISATATTQANENAIYLSDYIGTQVGDTTYFYGHQVEAKSYATPLVAGTRGTTNATGGGWVDLSGNGKHGELVNGPTYNSDNGGSLVFDGTNDYINLGNVGTIGNFQTIDVWFYSTSVTNYRNILDMNYGNYANTGNVGPRLEQSTGGSTGWVWSGNTTNNSLLNSQGTNYSISANTWYNATWVNNNGTVAVYLNGTVTASGISSPNGFLTTYGAASIGRGFHLDSSRYFAGRVPLLKIYNKALSATEVQQNFEATRARFGV